MIVVNSGNRMDPPGRARPRFPLDREAAVATRLRDLLVLLEPDGVVTAAAAGADLLMAEAAMQLGVPLHLVLPCPADLFRKVSVADQGERWDRALDRVLDHVATGPGCSLVELSLEPDDAGFRAANDGLLQRAAQLGANRVLAAVVRPRQSEETASVTDDFVARAEATGLFVVEIAP